jgi:cell wall-associated NlpC family hydrolase
MSKKYFLISYVWLCIFGVLISWNAFCQKKNHVRTDSLLGVYNDFDSVLVTNQIAKTKLLKADSMIQFGKKYLGLHYRRGGTSNRGYDCSGYTMTVFAKFGIRLPHTSAGQALIGIEVNSKNIQKGDLIFFKGRSRRGKRIGHVGIVVSERGQPVRFIHSSVKDGVREDWLLSDYYKKRFVKVMRVTNWAQ